MKWAGSGAGVSGGRLGYREHGVAGIPRRCLRIRMLDAGKSIIGHDTPTVAPVSRVSRLVARRREVLARDEASRSAQRPHVPAPGAIARQRTVGRQANPAEAGRVDEVAERARRPPALRPRDQRVDPRVPGRARNLDHRGGLGHRRRRRDRRVHAPETDCAAGPAARARASGRASPPPPPRWPSGCRRSHHVPARNKISEAARRSSSLAPVQEPIYALSISTP